MMMLGGCRVSSHLVGRVGVGPAVEQQAHHLELALPGCNDEAGGAVLREKREGGISPMVEDRTGPDLQVVRCSI